MRFGAQGLVFKGFSGFKVSGEDAKTHVKARTPKGAGWTQVAEKLDEVKWGCKTCIPPGSTRVGPLPVNETGVHLHQRQCAVCGRPSGAEGVGV